MVNLPLFLQFEQVLAEAFTACYYRRSDRETLEPRQFAQMAALLAANTRFCDSKVDIAACGSTVSPGSPLLERAVCPGHRPAADPSCLCMPAARSTQPHSCTAPLKTGPHGGASAGGQP